jgi:DHA1 family tetracycline resistance protein-like MFS transporter
VGRPLVALFLTIFVSLVGFGIIIPLLPFYAETYGASPVQIGLLFAAFSVSQLVASPVLGDLSDRVGRRPILILSLLGTATSFALLALAGSLWMLFLARTVDGLSGGNISTARAYIADVTAEEDRARAYGLIGAAFGLGFILGPALGAVFAHLSYTAPIWVATGLTLAATGLAWVWLPETVHRVRAGGSAWWRIMPEMAARRPLRRLLTIDFLYWFAFAMYQTTFALFGARRFGFTASQIGYLLSAFGLLGAFVQVGLIGPVVRALGERRVLAAGLALAALGLGLASVMHTVVAFVLALVPAGVGLALCNPSLASLLSRSADSSEQGRVQGVASALESLGRTLGPVLGNGMLQVFGEGAAYGSAAIVLGVTAFLTAAGAGNRVDLGSSGSPPTATASDARPTGCG